MTREERLRPHLGRLVGSHGPWRLWVRDQQSTDEWGSFKLAYIEKARRAQKVTYWLGFDGKRIAANKDGLSFANLNLGVQRMVLGWMKLERINGQ